MQAGLYLGADDYVTKPFERRELIARISTKLRVKQAEDSIRQQNKELHILPEIARQLNDHLDIDRLADIVLSHTVEAFGATAGHLIILNPKGPLHKTYPNRATPNVETQIPPISNLLDQIMEARQSLVIGNTRDDSRWRSTLEDPTRSAIIVPMLGRLDLIGLLILTHEQRGFFNLDQQPLLQAIASQAAIAIENTRLHSYIAYEQRRLDTVPQNTAEES
jgi:GAF domain-containing protein